MADEALKLAILLSLKDEASSAFSAIKEKLGGVGTAVAGGFVAAGVAVAGLGAALLDAGKAAAEEELGVQRLGAAVKATGADWDEASERIETYLEAETRRTALDDGEGRESLIRLTTTTGDYKKALELLPIAQDLAAAKGMNLSNASEIIGRVAEGNVTILTRYGITLEKGATAQEALAALQQKFAGQAEAYGDTYVGAQKKLDVAMGNLKETVGGLVLPIMTKFTEKLADLAMQALPYVDDAITRVGEFVETVLLPAFDEVVAFLDDPLIPIVQLLARWIGERLPGVIETLRYFCENTLIPALKGVWEFVQDPLIPILSRLGQWIGEHLPGFIDTLKIAWETVLLPALQTIWTFISDSLIPVLSDVATWVGTNLPPLLQTLAGWWRDTLHPAIDKVVAVVRDQLIPKFKEIIEFIRDTASVVLEKASGWFNSIRDAVGGVVAKIESFIGGIRDLIASLGGLHLPDWLTPGSPAPLETAMLGIADATWQAATANMALAASYSAVGNALSSVGTGLGTNPEDTWGLGDIVGPGGEHIVTPTTPTVMPPISTGILWQESWGPWPFGEWTNWDFNTAGYQQKYGTGPAGTTWYVRYAGWYRRGEARPNYWGTTPTEPEPVTPGPDTNEWSTNPEDPWGIKIPTAPPDVPPPWPGWPGETPGEWPSVPETPGVPKEPNPLRVSGAQSQASRVTKSGYNIYVLNYSTYRQTTSQADANYMLQLLELYARLHG